VEYANKSFIRLAVGAYAVREFLEKDAIDFHNDNRLIEVIEEVSEKMFG
jgi:hypothetical protein